MNILLALQENTDASLEELNDEEDKLIARLAEITIEKAQIKLMQKIQTATNFTVELPNAAQRFGEREARTMTSREATKS